MAKRRCNRAVPGMLLAVALGCGSNQLHEVERHDLSPVTGKVTFRDGKPFTAGTVVFHYLGEAEKYVLRAAIQGDGSYRLRYGNADGAPPGPYKVLVVPTPPADPAKPPPGWPPIDRSLSRWETSRLE